MKICERLKTKDVGAIGIGAMIVFIAMVLVAGIAASVLIQTSARLESQAMATGSETTAEVSTGIDVYDIEGNVSGSVMDKLVIMVRARAGSIDIDLSTTNLEIANTDAKYVLAYHSAAFNGAPATGGVFDTDSFELNATQFSIIELKDPDSSCAESTPVINRGDKVLITVNLTSTMGAGLATRKEIWGRVVPEEGAPGIISFRTPASYSDTVYDLQ